MLPDIKIEEVVDKIGGNFSAAVVAARRARQIRGYYVHLGQGTGEYIPPQVATYARNPLSIAMQEIVEGKVVLRVDHPEVSERQAGSPAEVGADETE